MRIVGAAVLIIAAATVSASAARKVDSEPTEREVKNGETVYYPSRSCRRANPAKPFKVVTSALDRRNDLGCFSESEAKAK